MVVFADADLDRAVQAAIGGMNLTTCQGQSCGSNSRIFVHEDVYPRYVSSVTEMLKRLRVGVAYDPDTDMGPLVSEQQLQRVLRYVEIGREAGGRVIVGGAMKGVAGGNGYFMEPTLFENLAVSDTMAQEEIFGPVISVFPWRDVEQVIEQANGVNYGLTASVWTRDVSMARVVARRLEAGYVWVNEHGPHYVGTPFGGYKNSGIGKEEAMDEILGICRQKRSISSSNDDGSG